MFLMASRGEGVARWLMVETGGKGQAEGGRRKGGGGGVTGEGGGGRGGGCGNSIVRWWCGADGVGKDWLGRDWLGKCVDVWLKKHCYDCCGLVEAPSESPEFRHWLCGEQCGGWRGVVNLGGLESGCSRLWRGPAAMIEHRKT